MKQLPKKPFVILLAAVMLLTMMPFTAIADGDVIAQSNVQTPQSSEKQEQKEDASVKTRAAEPEKTDETTASEKEDEKPASTKATVTPGPAKASETPAPAKATVTPGPAKAIGTPVPAKATETPLPVKVKASDTPVPAKASTTPAPEKADETDYPAMTLTASAGKVSVTLKAPEGSLPKGTKLMATPVYSQAVLDAVERKIEAQGRSMTDAVAIDVTPVDKDGREVQPKKSVTVSFSNTGLDLDAGGSVDVYHVSDDASSVTDMGGSGSANSQTFSTGHFSIYVASTTDPEASGSGTQGSRYSLHYGESVTLETSHTTSSTSYWSVQAGAQYITQGQITAKNYTIKNNNITSSNQQATVRWRRNNTNEYFYLTLLPAPVKHTVTYMLQDAGASSFAQYGEAEEVGDGKAANPPSLTAEKTGTDGKIYVTDGKWYTSNACTTEADLSKVTSDMTVYAKYTIKQHEVKFMLKDAGASSFAQDGAAKTVDDGASVTPPAHGSQKDDSQGAHYTFDGKWYTSEACTTEADLSQIKGDETFYAQYVPVKHTVTYKFKDAGASSFADDTVKASEEVDSGSGATSPAHDATKESGGKTWDFDGWYTSAACTEKADLSKITEDMTVYSRYVAEVKLTYEKNSGNDAATIPAPHEVEGATGSKVTLGTASRENYHFVGWNTKADGKGDSYAGGAEFTMPEEDVTLYAQWSQTTVTVTYYTDAETIFRKDENVPSNNNHYKVPSTHPDNTGYLFLGWRESDSFAVKYGPDEYCPTKEADIDLYAVWEKYDPSHLVYESLTGPGTEITYDGQPHTISDVEETDTNRDYRKYGNKGYVRVSDITDDNVHHHIYAYITPITVTGTNAGTYDTPEFADLYTHNNSTDKFEALGEVIPVTNYQLKINPVKVTISTDSASKLYDGEALTKNTGKIKVGDSAEKTFTSGDLVELVNGEKIKIEITGTQTAAGSSSNAYVIHWESDDTTADKENYEITDNPGTLKVYYSVKFDKNADDTVQNMPEDAEAEADPYTLPDNEPTRTHYTFDGWYLNADGTGTKYDPEGSYDFPDGEYEATFYAKWKIDQHTLTFVPNGGAFSGGSTDPKTETYDYGEEIKLLSEEPAYAGHTFMGWKDSHDNILHAGDDYTVVEDMTFTAQWSDEIETVTYNPNGGKYEDDTDPTSYQFVYNEMIKIAEAATRDGYEFKGWKMSDSDTVYQPGDEYTVTKSITFVAQWAQIHSAAAMIGGDGEGGTVTVSPKEAVAGTVLTITATPKAGYRFVVWKVDEGDVTLADGYSETTTFVMGDADVKVEAIFEEIPKVTVNFDSDGGSKVKSQEIYINETATKPGDPTKDGYTFLGWFLGDELFDFDMPLEADITLTAKWEKNPEPSPTEHTITYKLNGGAYNGSTEDIKEVYEAGTTIEIHEAPTRDGYTFLYWQGSEYQPGDSYEVTEDHTFVAQWEKDEEPTVSPTNKTPKTTKKTDKAALKASPAKKTSGVVRTGDASDIALWIVMILVGAFAMVVNVRIRRRR